MAKSPTNFSLLLSSQHLQQTRNALCWTFLNLFLLGCLEKSEWTARTTWKINLESGKMVVSGVADEDLENYMEDFPVAETGGDYELGCFVEIPKGEYSLTIYSYPPNDLSGGWMRIENPSLFRDCFGKDSDLKYEKPLDYFTRTRPDEPPPAWVKDGYESEDFLNFVIHLALLSDKLTAPPNLSRTAVFYGLSANLTGVLKASKSEISSKNQRHPNGWRFHFSGRLLFNPWQGNIPLTTKYF